MIERCALMQLCLINLLIIRKSSWVNHYVQSMIYPLSHSKTSNTYVEVLRNCSHNVTRCQKCQPATFPYVVMSHVSYSRPSREVKYVSHHILGNKLNLRTIRSANGLWYNLIPFLSHCERKQEIDMFKTCHSLFYQNNGN